MQAIHQESVAQQNQIMVKKKKKFETILKGIVIKSTGSWYHLLTEDGTTYQARIRGKFRIANIKHTNPIAVGDEVEFEIDKDDIAVITKISSIDKNYIIRKSVNLSKKRTLLPLTLMLLFGCNDWQILSKHRLVLFDRFLITAEAYHIPVVILFNKMDAYTEDE